MAPTSDNNEKNNNGGDGGPSRTPLSKEDPNGKPPSQTGARNQISDQLQSDRRRGTHGTRGNGASRGGLPLAATMTAGQRRATSTTANAASQQQQQQQQEEEEEEEEEPRDTTSEDAGGAAAAAAAASANAGEGGGDDDDIMNDPKVQEELALLLKRQVVFDKGLEDTMKKVGELTATAGQQQQPRATTSEDISNLTAKYDELAQKLEDNINATTMATAIANEAKGIANAANATATAANGGGNGGVATAQEVSGFFSVRGRRGRGRGRGRAHGNATGNGNSDGGWSFASAGNFPVVAIAIVLFVGFREQIINLFRLVTIFAFFVKVIGPFFFYMYEAYK